MRFLKAYISLICLGILLYSCEKKNNLQDELKDKGVSFKQLVEDKYSFEVERIVGESSGQTTVAQVGNYNYMTQDYGETWERTSLPSGAEVLSVSSKGRIIYEKNHTKYLYAETGTITFADQGTWRHYYIDTDDNIFYTKIAFSAGAVSELFIAPSGKSFWEKIEPPAEGLSFEYLGVCPEGGIAFFNAGGAIQHYLPDTKQWVSFPFSTERSISKAKTFVGQDGNYYIADQKGFDKITANGIVSSVEFPDSMLHYLNPLDIKVSNDGTVFVLLTVSGQYPSLYFYKDNKWDLFPGVLSSDIKIINGYSFYIAQNTVLYPGKETVGDILIGVAYHDLGTDETKVTGAKEVALIPSLVYQTQKGNILLSYPKDKNFYEYTEGKLVPLDVLGVSDIYEAPNGTMYLLSEDALTLMDANLNINTQVKGIFSKNGFLNQNGYPTSMVMQYLNDGTYALIGTLSYEYNVGGTGFKATLYSNYMLTSNDGITWTKSATFQGQSGKPSVIDENGVIFFDQINSYAGQSETHIPKRSDDGGTTWVNIEGYLPTLITSNGHLLHLLFGSVSNSVVIYEGDKWNTYNVNIDVGELLMSNRMSGNDKLIVVTRKKTYISEQSFSDM